MAQKYTEARKEGNKKWDAANLDRISIALPKGRKDTIKAHAADLGESVNGFIGRAISETMERDGGGTPSETAGKPAGAEQGAGVVSFSEAIRTAQEGTETGKQPVPVDNAKAAESLFSILGGLGTVDLDKARRERLGIVYLPPDTLKAAQQAAETAGEAVADFMQRAVAAQAQRDQTSLKLGINPATGGKLEKEA